MTRIAVLCLPLFLGGCWFDGTGCDEAYSITAMHSLPPRNGRTCSTMDCSEKAYEDSKVWIAQIREKALRQDNRCLRAAFNSWADYYDWSVDNDRADVVKWERANKLSPQVKG